MNPSTTTSTPPMPRTPKSLTLIVATTTSLGIGRAGTLPWPQLKQEMAYFARVTKRQPPPTTNAGTTPNNSPKQTVNAVIMGRKTWDSIPPKFRPLKDRLNVVISKSMEAPEGAEGKEEGPVVAGSLDKALEVLGGGVGNVMGKKEVGDVFVIGGASVYAAALAHPRTKRVLVTKIREPDFECDTFFPVDLEGDEARGQWRLRGKRELVEFVGKEALGGKDGEEGVVRTEGEVSWEYCLYEKEDS